MGRRLRAGKRGGGLALRYEHHLPRRGSQDTGTDLL